MPERPARPAPDAAAAPRLERLGIVSYANVAPLHYGLVPWSDGESRVEFVHGVPTELNARLLAGEIDLTLVSSIEFVRRRDALTALPDFSIATLGPVRSVMLFHWRPFSELDGARIAVTRESATSVELLRALLAAEGMRAALVPHQTDLDAMLTGFDAALLIGDRALTEAIGTREIGGRVPLVTDLGDAWYRLARLPFTFAVWASRGDRPPSARLVRELRSARERGLGELTRVSEVESVRRGVPAPAMFDYLANFRYHLEPPDREGLHEFARRTLGDEFHPDQLRYWPV